MFVVALLSGFAGYGYFDYELARPLQLLSLALTVTFPIALGIAMRSQLKRPNKSSAVP
jgi:hypothetical protein